MQRLFRLISVNSPWTRIVSNPPAVYIIYVLPNERLLYYRRCLFCWLELYTKYDRPVIDPSMCPNLFLIRYLCVLTHVTRKLKVIKRRSLHRMTAVLSEMSFCLLQLDPRYDWPVVLPNTYRSVFPISQTITRITWKLKLSYMDVLHIEWLLYYRKHSICSLDLLERSHWRVTAPHKHWSLSNKNYVPKPQARTYITMYVWVRMTTKLTYLMTTYYTPNNGFIANDGFMANVASFYNSKVGYLRYTLQCFSINRAS